MPISQPVNAIGVGQTWQDVAGSRAGNTVYQNTTGRPIMVKTVSTNGCAAYCDVNVACTALAGASTSNAQHTFIVPAGWYYKVGDGSFAWIAGSWHELR